MIDVDADEVDRVLRTYVEDQAGRSISDDEWRIFKSRQLAASAGQSSKTSAWSERLAGAGGLLAFIVIVFLIGVLVSALYLGLMWAFDPQQLKSEDLAKSVGGFFGGAALVGFWAVVSYAHFPKTTAVVGGLFLFGGLTALVIGAILRVS